ncbi:hypothetical protein F2P56_026028 [Juglans regia]|uniref:Uncharacterized protein LOC109009545 n=2 Tax=Juglans regia TaxID=51240 RepID=A0A2I4GNY1_JUGRE|nr:uncharacterized protein LOC109009545 [Juglans regia]KAF5456558.1 hypothetical protein F2P56_026028 [Juglans regia]
MYMLTLFRSQSPQPKPNPMNSSTTSPDPHIEVNFTSSCRTPSPNEPNDSNAVPLLLQPSYARSKSLIFDELRNFRISLRWCALDHSSCIGKSVSYFTFIFFTILVPFVMACFSVRVPAAASTDDPISFNKLVQLPESGLAAIAFFTLSGFFHRYGLRQLLLLEGLQEDSLYVQRGYKRELDKAFRYLAIILLPSFFVELVHKIIFFSTVRISFPYVSASVALNCIVLVLVLVSWVYRTGLFLLVCVLFRLTCELQILRFEGFQKMFEGCESDCGVIFKEHARIRKQLLVTSHRYRLFIIACMVTITVSQFVALLLVLASKSEKTFFNSGDLVVCSAAQLSGFLLCLLGAARITHRAQGIVSVATRWHMVVTCASTGSNQGKGRQTISDQAEDCVRVSKCDHSDSESSEIFVSISPALVHEDPASLSQTRQALVTYLQHNNGGITLFGFALDRGLLHTLFAFEFSLMLWILSKVVVLS